MKDRVNVMKFTVELIDNGFIDEDYFYGKKLNKMGSNVMKKS